MIAYADLLALAYRKERASSRRLAASAQLSAHDALVRVLRESAGAGSLETLLAARAQALRDAAAAVSARRQAKQAAHAARQRARQPDGAGWFGWFDGSAHPNPGRMGIGALLQGPGGERVEISRAAGDGDSNEAEYRALIAVLEAALSFAPAHLTVHGDSQVVIGDVQGEGAGVARLASSRETARRLLAALGNVTLRWVPRARNSAADALSQRVIVR